MNNTVEFFKKNLGYGIIASIMVLTTAILCNQPVEISLIASILSFPIAILLVFFWKEYSKEKARKELEKEIPDMLLQASLFPKSASLLSILKYFEKTNYRHLSREFEKAITQIENGFSIKKALEEMKKRNNSTALNRALELLEQANKTGAEMNNAFQAMAFEILETKNILEEKKAIVSIQKYTILLSAGIIVPLILGMVASVSSNNFSALISQTSNASQLAETAKTANIIYLAEFALIASIFTALQEEQLKKFVLYAIILIPMAQAVYFLAQIVF